ncbi:actin-like protein 8 [Chionomys nivalis]|uniref:actin-like protein 8 n=1 Tax=Chionomys nivalis TaxID=269649 RepID=UPI002594FF3B|nr:actin-like protein 8 [Chionomys nivalis]
MATRTLIIDRGSGFLKASLSHWNEPWAVVQSIVNCLPCAENPGSSEASKSPQLGIGMLYHETFSYSMQLDHVMIWEGCPLLSYRKTLEFTRQELLVYLSKSLFPGTHGSSNLYLMNGAAGVQAFSWRPLRVPKHQMLSSRVVACGENGVYPGFTESLYNELC